MQIDIHSYVGISYRSNVPPSLLLRADLIYGDKS